MLITSVLGIVELYDSIQNQQMPFALSYKISKLRESIDKDKIFYSHKAKQILEEFAIKDDDGNYIYLDSATIKIDPDRRKECEDRFKELDSIEIDTPDISFTIDELSSLNLSPRQVQILMPFIK